MKNNSSQPNVTQNNSSFKSAPALTFKSDERPIILFKPNQSFLLSLVSVFIFILSLGSVGYLYKQPLTSFWYQITGRPLPTYIQPLILQNIQYNLSVSPNPADDSQNLTIEGMIVNPNAFITDAPVLRISVWADCQGNLNETKSPLNDCLYLEWLYRPTVLQINASETISFQTSYPISAKISRVEVAIP